MLWILTPTLSDRILAGMGAKLELEVWGEGVYVMPSSLKTGLVVIHQLPQTPETLWFRLLGKGKVQERAIKQVEDWYATVRQADWRSLEDIRQVYPRYRSRW
jgi:HigB_toxin, RelE-like toxic component of a toxin-antitoxin system